MTKKMKELKEQINSKLAEAKKLNSEGGAENITKAASILDEIDTLEKAFEIEEKLYEREKKAAATLAEKQLEKKPAESTKKFASTIRGMIKKEAMTEGVNEDGGYTVPEDILTKIEKYPTTEFSVEPYITTEPVSTNKGARTYEKKGKVTPFAEVDEGGAIPASATPKFERKTYTIADKGGMIPITNDLINDSDNNFEAYLVEHLHKKKIATINSEFFTAMTAGEATVIKTLADIKEIINVTIGSAYNSIIMTNDDGWNWLDCLEDKNGRPLLTPYGNEDNHIGRLSIGGSIISVVRVPNSEWASKEMSIPFIIGDTKAAFRRFDRQQLEVKISDVASIDGFNAFSQNGALLRAFMRDDAKVWDPDAFVYAEISTQA